ncbi:unnamed protein product [Trichobilharzia regenti]|nr:unnamed protein product [Trichobilharzia regenti]
MGISRLPQSAPAFVDSNRNTHVTEGSVESSLTDATGQSDSDNNSSTNTSSTLNRNSSIVSSVVLSGSDLSSSLTTGFNSSSSSLTLNSQSSTVDSHSTTPLGSLVTRVNLAGLLRSSLPLVNDVQLLTLAQIALLMPGPTSSSGIVSAGASSIAGGASTYPSSSDNVSELASPAPTVLSEREKIVNTLARHCILTPTGTATAATTTPAAVNDSNLLYESTGSQAGGGGISASGAASGSYKSTNPRVLAALDALRRDIERCHVSSVKCVPSFCFSFFKCCCAF